jgi:hypothetical protein
MAAGIVGVSAGGIMLLAAAIVATQISCDFSTPSGGCTTNSGAEIGLTIGGIVGIAAGILLLIYGAKRVPVGTAAASVPSPLPKWAGAPAGKGWRWEF